MKKISVISLLFVVALLFAGCAPKPQSVSIDESAVPNQAQQPSAEQVRGYVDYSENAIAQATQNNGKAVLFFHAGWCPTCRAAEKSILDNAQNIPADLTIIKTDFDSMTELKKQYQIVNQHTFVQVDAQGNEITRWVGGDLETILQRVQG